MNRESTYANGRLYREGEQQSIGEAPAPAHRIVVRDEERILFTATRWNGDELRVSLGSHKGKPVVQIRDWYDAGGQFRPSKRGISLPVLELAAIASALEQALEQIGRDGHRVPTRAERDAP